MKVNPNPQSAADVSRNNASWNTNAHLLFIDQPVGTGFSYSKWPLDYVTNEKQVAQQLYDFLQVFIVQFPQFATRPLFITGESYAVRAQRSRYACVPMRSPARAACTRNRGTTCQPSAGRLSTPTRQAVRRASTCRASPSATGWWSR
jgi:hypothetical protein